MPQPLAPQQNVGATQPGHVVIGLDQAQGRNAAVASVGKIQVRGWFAWAMWLAVHIVFLIGFRNRLLVLINWTWDYFFYDRPIRLIMHDGNCPWGKCLRSSTASETPAVK